MKELEEIMANKLKIFEKLGIIEKRELVDETVKVDADISIENEMQDEYANVEANNIEVNKAFDEEIEIEKLQTPILNSNPIIQAALTENTLKNLETLDLFNVNQSEPQSLRSNMNNPSISAVKDSGLIEDVEKKLDAMIESYERNKLLSIEDIYRKSSLILDVRSTVFMVDVYSKALPENLPIDVKRDSVLNIMKASEIRIDDLLSDAYKRIDALNNVLESVVQSTDELKSKNTATIKDLEKRIEELKRNMLEREKFQETQNTMIEYEIQRIINIVDFVKPK